jgi:hypothetical protein
MTDASLEIPRRLNDPPRMFWWDLDVSLLVLAAGLAGMISGFFHERLCAGRAARLGLRPREDRQASGLRAAPALLACAGRRHGTQANPTLAPAGDGGMKLAWMPRTSPAPAGRRRFLVVLLVGSMLVNLILAVFAVRLAGHERIVVVPPTIHKTFWVESDRVSSEYLEQMGYFLMQLTLNVTPQSVDHQAKVLLQYAARVVRRAAHRAARRRRTPEARRRLDRLQRAGPGRRRTHAAGRCARPAHHLHQRPPRLGSLEGLRHRTSVRGWPHVPQGLS